MAACPLCAAVPGPAPAGAADPPPSESEALLPRISVYVLYPHIGLVKDIRCVKNVLRADRHAALRILEEGEMICLVKRPQSTTIY